jgi:DNA repair protein RadC
MDNTFFDSTQQLEAEHYLRQYFEIVGLDSTAEAVFWQTFPSLIAVKSATQAQIQRFTQQHPQYEALWVALQLGQIIAHATTPKILNARRSEDIGQLLQKQMGHLKQEQLWVILLDAQLDVLGWEVVFVGTLTHVQASPREIFQRALHYNAYAIMVAHNHPSGHTQPSRADITFSQQLHLLSQQLELPLLDAFVVTQHHYWSMAEHQQFTTK